MRGGSLRRRHTHSVSCSEEAGAGRGNGEAEVHGLNMEVVTWDVGGGDSNPPFPPFGPQSPVSREYTAPGGEALGDEDGSLDETRLWG